MIGPASTGQEEIWVSCGLERDVPLFAVSIVLELTGTPNVPLLEQAIGALVARHEVLRTTYHPSVDGLAQHVGEPWPVRIACCDLSALDAEITTAIAAKIHQEEARTAFDLRHGPVIRARLIARGGGRCACLFTVHHIAIDGWSMGVFARDLEAIHTAFHRGERPVLPELTLRYIDFARLQRERVAEKTGQIPLAAIRDRFRVPPLVFHAEKRCAADTWWESEHVRLPFPQPLHAQRGAFGREVKATRFVVFTAILWMVLYANSRRTPFVMATDYANRGDPGAGSVMGLFVTQLLLKSSINPDATFTETIRQVQREFQQALAQAECPVSALLPDSVDLRDAPPFRVKLVFQPHIDRPRLANLDVAGVDVLSALAKFDLLFTVHTDTDYTIWDLQYRKAMFNHTDMMAMLRDVETLTRGAIERPQARVDSLLGDVIGLREDRAKSGLSALKRELLSAVTGD
jgi:hypothetical protein